MNKKQVSRKTVGAIASELQQKHQDPVSAIDLQRATEKEYLDNLVWAADHARKKVDCSNLNTALWPKNKRVAVRTQISVYLILPYERHIS